MSNIHTAFYKLTTAAFLVAGFVTLTGAATQYLYASQLAQLTEQGTVLVVPDPEGTVLAPTAELQPRGLHHAAGVVRELEGVSIAVGMLLILIGFFLHAAFVMQHDHVTKVASLDSFWTEERRKKN
jgi:hypothetical protein